MEVKLIHMYNNVSEVIDLDTGESIGRLIHNQDKWDYSPEICQLLLDELYKGGKLSEICKRKDFPSYQTLSHWKKENDEFNSALMDALQASGQIWFDKAASVVEQATNDTVKVDKLKSDFYLKAAAAYNQDQFGNKTKVSGEVAVSQIYAIDTGITRNVDAILDKVDEADLLGEGHGDKHTEVKASDATDIIDTGDSPEVIDDRPMGEELSNSGGGSEHG
jgi:hypothetical protein